MGPLKETSAKLHKAQKAAQVDKKKRTGQHASTEKTPWHHNGDIAHIPRTQCPLCKLPAPGNLRSTFQVPLRYPSRVLERTLKQNTPPLPSTNERIKETKTNEKLQWPPMRWEELKADGIRVESAIRYVQSGGCRGGEVVGCPEWVPRFVPSPLSALCPQTRWLKVRTVDPIFFPS